MQNLHQLSVPSLSSLPSSSPSPAQALEPPKPRSVLPSTPVKVKVMQCQCLQKMFSLKSNKSDVVRLPVPHCPTTTHLQRQSPQQPQLHRDKDQEVPSLICKSYLNLVLGAGRGGGVLPLPLQAPSLSGKIRDNVFCLPTLPWQVLLFK